MKRVRYLLYAVTAVGLAAVAALLWFNDDGPKVLARVSYPNGNFSVDLLSAPYTLDRIYLSMRGPRSNQPRIQLAPAEGADKTLWLTGMEVDVVDAKDLTDLSREFFCHSNLTLNPETTSPQKHNASFAAPAHANWRLFTLVPGRTSIRLPQGFGVPVKNGTLLDNFTMTLNQNPGEPERTVRVKTRLWYRQSGDGKEPLQPLFRRGIYVYQQHAADGTVADSSPAAAAPAPVPHQGELCGESCRVDQKGTLPSTFQDVTRQGLDAHPGASCCVENATPEGIMAQFGLQNTVHWMVPPGRHRYRAEVTRQLDLPFDTSAHYVTGHLHPFGTSLKLVDMKTKETVFEIVSRNFHDRLGVESISEISSRAGVPLYRGRQYELIADYDNPTKQPIDAMAIMYVYCLDVPPASPSRTLGHLAR